ncbi:MAG: phosphate uptake regulator PhoU [Candidatus Woesearchaeota archaeon]
MKRKINQVGTGTLTISLPSKWVEECELKKGDELEITQEGRKLLLSPEEVRKEVKTISFEIKDKPWRWARKFLYSSYKQGYDEITFRFSKPEMIDDISKELNNLIGMEIVSHKINSCVIKNVASPLKESFNDLVNKAFLVTIAMGEDILNSLKIGKTSSLNLIRKQEETQNKLTLAGVRLLHEYNFSLVKDPQITYMVVSLLEAIGDDLKYICNFYQDKIIKLSPRVETLFSKFIDLLKNNYYLYNKFDVEKHLQIAEEKYELINFYAGKSQAGELSALIAYLQGAMVKLYDIERELFYRDIDQSPGVGLDLDKDEKKS